MNPNISRKVDPPSKMNTCVAIPSGDCRIDLECTRGLLASLPLWGGMVDYPACSNVAQARNLLISGFMKTPFDWCVMIDSDIGFDISTMRELLAAPGLVVNSSYARKDDSGERITNGLGFTRVHRSVFHAMEQQKLVMRYRRDTEWITAFFASGCAGVDGPWLGEDAFFWLCVKELEIEVTQLHLDITHYGRAAYYNR